MAAQYVVVDSNRKPVSPVVNTPSRAQFYRAAFSAQWPQHTYHVVIAGGAQ